MTTLNNFRVDFSATLQAEFVAIKKRLTSMERRYLFNGLNTRKTVNLNQLDYTTCGDDLNFRKAVYPKLRFWMADLLGAGKAGALTKEVVIDICTFVRATASYRIGILRSLYPAQPEVIEVVECDETGRPVIEVQAEYIAELEAEIEKAAEVISDATKHISNLKDKNKRLTVKNKQLQAKLSTLQLATQAYNRVVAR